MDPSRPPTPVSSEIAVELRAISKRFGRLQANDAVSLRARRGTIHALIGENGAGKSTAMKILYGQLSPDTGEILVDGKRRAWASPRDAIAAGIGMVHQHFMLAEPFSVLENVVLGAEGGCAGRLGWLDHARAREALRRLGEANGIRLNWDASVESLPIGLQQQVEILKLLYRHANVLVLDEPTAVLSPPEAQDLFRRLRAMADAGKTIIVITHKLGEVMAHADDVTILRAGKVVGTRRILETSAEELGLLMVGRQVVAPRVGDASSASVSPSIAASPVAAPAALEIEALQFSRDGRRIGPLSLRVAPGEVVGIAGVEGNGQSELMRAILHPRDFRAASEGRVTVLGRPALGPGVRPPANRALKDWGVSLVPEDRHREGLLLHASLEENFLLGQQRSRAFRRGWWRVDRKRLRAAAQKAVRDYDVRPPRLDAAAQELSGGNQQKLIIARELERRPGLLIAAQPTRGIDVGAIEFIHRQILAARARGAGVLLISSELDEIMNLSDRVLVLFDGRIAGELGDRAAIESPGGEARLGLWMGGGSDARSREEIAPAGEGAP